MIFDLDTAKIITLVIAFIGLILGIRSELRNHKKHLRDKEKDNIQELKEKAEKQKEQEILNGYYWLIINDAFLLSWTKNDIDNIIHEFNSQILEAIIDKIEEVVPLAMRYNWFIAGHTIISLNRIRDGARRILIYSEEKSKSEIQLSFGLAKFYSGIADLDVKTSKGMTKLSDSIFEKRSEFFDNKYFQLKD